MIARLEGFVSKMEREQIDVLRQIRSALETDRLTSEPGSPPKHAFKPEAPLHVLMTQILSANEHNAEYQLIKSLFPGAETRAADAVRRKVKPTSVAFGPVVEMRLSPEFSKYITPDAFQTLSRAL